MSESRGKTKQPGKLRAVSPGGVVTLQKKVTFTEQAVKQGNVKDRENDNVSEVKYVCRGGSNKKCGR